MDSSASNHVTGLENGSGSGWWTHSVGGGIGTFSGTSWGSPWGQSYDETVTYPGFYEGAYYGNAYRGNNADEYIDYLGDAFREYPGSDGGFFPFAYSVSVRRNTWGKWRGLTAGVAGETHRAISEPIHNALEKHPPSKGSIKRAIQS